MFSFYAHFVNTEFLPLEGPEIIPQGLFVSAFLKRP